MRLNHSTDSRQPRNSLSVIAARPLVAILAIPPLPHPLSLRIEDRIQHFPAEQDPVASREGEYLYERGALLPEGPQTHVVVPGTGMRRSLWRQVPEVDPGR